MFTGNFLQTNSWLKHKLQLQDNKLTMSEEESLELYWHLRSEYASKKWVDVYTAMVLIVRYGEFPSVSNVPGNSDCEDNLFRKRLSRFRWSLPTDFVDRFLTAANIDAKKYSFKVVEDSPQTNHNGFRNEDVCRILQEAVDKHVEKGTWASIVRAQPTIEHVKAPIEENNIVYEKQPVHKEFPIAPLKLNKPLHNNKSPYTRQNVEWKTKAPRVKPDDMSPDVETHRDIGVLRNDNCSQIKIVIPLGQNQNIPSVSIFYDT